MEPNILSHCQKPLQIICDFDGTITIEDTTDSILKHFAHPKWEEIEKDWLDGTITAKECMSRQIALINTDPQGLDLFLDSISVSPGFDRFVSFCTSQDFNLSIASDGLDYSINRILSRYGYNIPVQANKLIFDHHGYSLEFPHTKPDCNQGLCKCAIADKLEGTVILIGDGHSDFCLANQADLVFARADFPLEAHCQEKNLSYLTYSDFTDIILHLARLSSLKPPISGFEHQFQPHNINPVSTT